MFCVGFRQTHLEAPKKLPANCIFVKENFAKFHEENPEMPNKKLFKVMNEKFKELSNKEKVLSAKDCLKINHLSCFVQRCKRCDTKNSKL